MQLVNNINYNKHNFIDMGLLNKSKKHKKTQMLNLLGIILEKHNEKIEKGSLKRRRIEKAITVLEDVKKGKKELDEPTWKRIEQWYKSIKESVESKKTGKDKKAKELYEEEEKLLNHLVTLLIHQ